MIVVNTMPATEIGLRIRRTSPAMRLALLQAGRGTLLRLREGLERWMEQHTVRRLDEARGRSSLEHTADPAALRARERPPPPCKAGGPESHNAVGQLAIAVRSAPTGQGLSFACVYFGG